MLAILSPRSPSQSDISLALDGKTTTLTKFHPYQRPSNQLRSPTRDNSVNDTSLCLDALSLGKNRNLFSDTNRPIARDSKYYIDDGSVTLLVDNVLFKVHRSTLAKDSSIFSTMFELRQPANSDNTTDVEGTSDDNPIILDEKAKDFRSLLWALYALPHELHNMNTPSADLNLLTTVARMANKYSYESLETWAFDALYRQIAAATANKAASPTGKPSVQEWAYFHVLDVALKCGQINVTRAALRAIKRVLPRASRPALAFAMSWADDRGFEPLIGLAYYQMALRGPTVWEAESRLTQIQKIRLYVGHTRLTEMWHSLEQTAVPFQHANTSPPPANAPDISDHTSTCNGVWQALWNLVSGREITVRIRGPADILGRLHYVGVMVSKKDDHWGRAGIMGECKDSAFAAVKAKHDEIEAQLPWIFGVIATSKH